MIYTLFRDSVNTIQKYLNDINFKNIFLTNYFWHIDEKRRAKNEIFLNPLSKAEKQTNGLLKPFS